MPRTFLQSFFAPKRATEQETDYRSLPQQTTGNITGEYHRLVSDELRRWGVTDKVATVQVIKIAETEQGIQTVAALVRLVAWEPIVSVRVMLGVPALERKIRKLLPGLWLADVSRFAGIWLAASTELQRGSVLTQIRHTLDQLAGPRSKATRCDVSVGCPSVDRGDLSS
jgi:hypothetical protein